MCRCLFMEKYAFTRAGVESAFSEEKKKIFFLKKENHIKGIRKKKKNTCPRWKIPSKRSKLGYK
jgi:hypothetical protein